MCLMHMNSEELKTRVSKYKYTTGFIGATGGWHYTQLEKFLVSDPDDIGYFDKNVTDVDESGYYGNKIDWKDKWTFDGTPALLLDCSRPYGESTSKAFTFGSNYLLQAANSSEPSPLLYSYARLAIGTDNDGNLLYDNPWEKEGVPAYKDSDIKNSDYIIFNDWQNLPMTTGIQVPSGYNIPNVNFYKNPFPYLEMCGT